MMNFDEIKEILAMMKEHELLEFELERDDFKVRLRKQSSQPPTPEPTAGTGRVPPAEISSAPPAPPVVSPPDLAADDELDLAIVKSPIVGTFYRAAEPGATPYAEVGDVVRNGQVICIIEAMKLMNEINAECDGEVVKVYVENGHAVQYGERLFAIKPQ